MSIRATIDQQAERALQKWDELVLREKVILAAMLLVIIAAVVWVLHTQANKAQTAATTQREKLVLMRAQTPNIQTGNQNSLPVDAMIQNAAQQQGLSPMMTSSGEAVQVEVTHQNFAVLGNWLSRMAEQGISISQLDIEQLATGELKLKAVMQKSN